MLFNPDPDNRDTGLLALVPRRIEQLAEGLKISEERVTAWGFVKAVLSQVWSCEPTNARLGRALDVATLLEPRLQ
jgi:streptomycin 6-kinase